MAGEKETQKAINMREKNRLSYVVPYIRPMYEYF